MLLACSTVGFLTLLAVLLTASRADNRRELTLRPTVGEALMGQGVVVEHRAVLDVTGRFFGLCKMTVYREGGGYPDVAVWSDILPRTVDIKYASPDREREGHVVIWYKLPGEYDLHGGW